MNRLPDLAAPADALGERPRVPSAPILLGGLCALCAAGLALVRGLAPGDLIRPLSPDLVAAAVFVGVLCGLLLAGRLVMVGGRSDGGGARRLDALAGALILPLLISTASLRLGVQAVAFVGVAPLPVTPMIFTVDGFRVNHGSHLLRVRLGDAGRTFSVHAPRDVYDAAQRGDGITLPVETGRFGIQRARVMGDLTTADLHHAP